LLVYGDSVRPSDDGGSSARLGPTSLARTPKRRQSVMSFVVPSGDGKRELRSLALVLLDRRLRQDKNKTMAEERKKKKLNSVYRICRKNDHNQLT